MDAVSAPQSKPEKPNYLNDVAGEEWDRITKVLDEMGMLSSADQTTLAAYCECWGRYREAIEEIKLNGKVVVSKTGYPMPSAWVTIMQTELKNVMSFLTQLGFSPAARARMAIDIQANRDDPSKTKWTGKVR